MKDELNELKEKVHKIETYFKIAFSVAVIFGVVGSFGAKLLSDVNSEIKKVESDKNQIIEDIGREKNVALKEILEEKELALSLINEKSETAIEDALDKVKNINIYQCPNGTNGWNPGGKWGFYGCKGQLSSVAQCVNIEYPHSQTLDCELIGTIRVY